ncbi:hypothetical protein DFJ43DRAFT_744983 [Lentinula guzmanii]|uniref:Uncharacterized protein n=1 Tax=Lentinula guzmanii TaxID=2804957 RepID=A0AA38MWB6_9AGAR|nr:hypothetical protein DFJ43DRAFT_744983 [Lentinula guzmanii]
MSRLTQWQFQGDSESYSESEGVLVHVIPPGISLLLYGMLYHLVLLKPSTSFFHVQDVISLYPSLACSSFTVVNARLTRPSWGDAMLALASTASVIIQCVNQGRALLALWNSEAALWGAASTSKIVQDNMKTALIYDYAVLGIYVFSNVLADALLLYRCYIIWEKDLRVVLLPLLGYLCNIVFGILGLTYNTDLVFDFWILAVVENVVLAALITGKIWYIRREAGGFLVLPRK